MANIFFILILYLSMTKMTSPDALSDCVLLFDNCLTLRIKDKDRCLMGKLLGWHVPWLY